MASLAAKTATLPEMIPFSAHIRCTCCVRVPMSVNDIPVETIQACGSTWKNSIRYISGVNAAARLFAFSPATNLPNPNRETRALPSFASCADLVSRMIRLDAETTNDSRLNHTAGTKKHRSGCDASFTGLSHQVSMAIEACQFRTLRGIEQKNCARGQLPRDPRAGGRGVLTFGGQMRRIFNSGIKQSLFVGTSIAGLMWSAAPVFAQSEETVIVTGTRVQGMTAADSAAPITVLGTDALTHGTGSTDLRQQLGQTVPSFTAQQFGGDTANLTLSAALRGLSPNDTLVLVNGKRRHYSGNLNVDGGNLGSGSDSAGLSLIPSGAIDHVEVLLDGAAAQYGTDAVAGVVNIILKNKSSGGALP